MNYSSTSKLKMGRQQSRLSSVDRLRYPKISPILMCVGRQDNHHKVRASCRHNKFVCILNNMPRGRKTTMSMNRSSPPSDLRMGEEMMILGGSYQSLALRCWKNNEKEDTTCFAYVIMWLRNGKLKATKIRHENLETKSEWQDRNDNADSYMEAMFIQFPKVARMAEKFIHTVFDHGAKDQDHFVDLIFFQPCHHGD